MTVTKISGRKEQTGEDEHVGVHDPLQRGSRDAEFLLDARQGDVHDGVVKPDDHERERQHGEDLPAVLPGG
jgi:hypothetical protein